MNITLEKLLKAPKIKDLRGEFYLKRLGITLTHNTFSSKQYNQYASDSMSKKIKMDSKEMDSDMLDIDKLRKTVILNHVIEPNLRDADFLKEAGYTSPYDMLNDIFTAEELMDIYNSIRDLGNIDINESIEQAKN
jgi:hypothetical protein